MSSAGNEQRQKRPSHPGKQAAKLRKKPKLKLIAFNEESRKEFITGFHARRVQRQTRARQELATKARSEQRQKRREQKRVRSEYHEQIHPSLFQDHKLIAFSDDEHDARAEPAQENIQEFEDNDYETTVVTTMAVMDFSDDDKAATPAPVQLKPSDASPSKRLAPSDGKRLPKLKLTSKGSSGHRRKHPQNISRHQRAVISKAKRAKAGKRK